MLAMDEGVVEEWLSEFKTLPDTAVSSYAASLKDKGSLVPALYKVIRENYSDLLEPVCHQLFEFYRSGEPCLQRFTLQFLPELVWSYLSVTAARDPHCSGCIEALLLGIYNLVRALLNNTRFTQCLCVFLCVCRCNGEVELGSRALDDVLYRAQLELFPEALLVGNAIKSSLHGASLKANKEGTRSIQVEITPTAPRISRNAVTSLSIRGHRWKRHDAVDLGSPDELTEIAEVDEGICTQTSTTPSIVISSSGGGGKLSGKGLRRLTGRSSKDKDKEAASSMDQLTRKQPTVRAMSENLELLSLKRLTLTASQSVPKSGSLSLSRTASAVFSRSFEQVSNVLSSNHVAEADHGGVAYLEHLSPAHQPRQRSPTISIHVTSDL
ncbi:hyccin-like [Sinocyclocheilus rhinocerous]|uniref:hyccin-like n=1 Tax=Sinocyclocheilus rhinocerous TaxID=307959 RepID=UPI0007B96017|nr:PREDICTED: hyccin-like [Sinocyclocheilus rhinocerous]